MDEFNNRMEAQRLVLQVVNHRPGFSEELLGLSRKAIERWLASNQLEPSSEVAKILLDISAKLFFLSSKSQEQVTEEYGRLSREVESLREKLNEALKFCQPPPSRSS